MYAGTNSAEKKSKKNDTNIWRKSAAHDATCASGLCVKLRRFEKNRDHGRAQNARELVLRIVLRRCSTGKTQRIIVGPLFGVYCDSVVATGASVVQRGVT